MIKLPENYIFTIKDINKVILLKYDNRCFLCKVIKINRNAIMTLRDLSTVGRVINIFRDRSGCLSEIFILEEDIDYFLL